MNYKEKLSQVCNEIDGATACFISGYDGILIEKFDKGQTDIDMVAAEWASICSKILSHSKSLKEIMATFSDNTIAIKPFENGFVGIVMNPDANLGRAKFELNRLGNDFV